MPHFLEDMRAQTSDREQQRSLCGRYITMLGALKNTYSGRQFEAQYPGVLRWPELIPQRIQQMTFEREVRDSLRQLTGASQSRGMRI